MFDIYHGTVPSYMLELCKRCTDSRLRSAAEGDFSVPRTSLRFTDRSFTVAGPKARNALPSKLRDLVCKDSFHEHLKTRFIHYFNYVTAPLWRVDGGVVLCAILRFSLSSVRVVFWCSSLMLLSVLRHV